jgi:predicted nucleic acid-binding protein
MQAIVDTGPLVAFFDRSERYHRWPAERVGELDSPLLVCESVLAEAAYLLARFPRAHDALFDLLKNGALVVAFQLGEHIGALHRLLRKYQDTPMSLADACVVRMAEIHDNHSVLTIDSDFTVYRKHGRVPITLIHPAVDPTEASRLARPPESKRSRKPTQLR